MAFLGFNKKRKTEKMAENVRNRENILCKLKKKKTSLLFDNRKITIGKGHLRTHLSVY